jgi:hypothetical protein
MFLHFSESNEAYFALQDGPFLLPEVRVLEKLTPPLVVLPEL